MRIQVLPPSYDLLLEMIIDDLNDLGIQAYEGIEILSCNIAEINYH